MDDRDNKTPGSENGQDEVLIWHKNPKNKKKSYIYEVPKEPEPTEVKAEAEEVLWNLDKPKRRGKNSNEPEERIWGGESRTRTQKAQEGFSSIQFKEETDEELEALKAEREARRKAERERELRAYETRRTYEEETSSYEAPAEEEPEYLSKEERQRRLKGNMIQGAGRDTGHRGGGGFFRRNRGRLLVVVLLLAIILGGGAFFNRIRSYNKFELDWQTSAVESGYSSYVAFGDVILHYSQDGVSCMNTENGEVLWDQAYNMDVPACSMRENYVVIYDVKGKDFYICTPEGAVGHGTTEKKILKADVSASGVVAVVLDDKKANYIEYYNKDGSQIEVTIKTRIEGDGYPLDIAVSPDGEQLMTSYIYAKDGKMLSEVVFRNFEVGKNNTDRVVGGFKEYEESLIPEVMFFDDVTSAAVTEYAISFYSTKNALNPKLSKTQEFDQLVRSVCNNESYVAVVLEPDTEVIKETKAQETTKAKETAKETASTAAESTDNENADEKNTGEESSEAGTTAAESTEEATTVAATETEEETETKKKSSGSNEYLLKVFDKNGKQVFKDTIDFPYEKIQFTGNGLVVYNNTICAVYNMTGVCKFYGSLNVELDDVMRFGERTLVVHGNGALQKIILK